MIAYLFYFIFFVLFYYFFLLSFASQYFRDISGKIKDKESLLSVVY